MYIQEKELNTLAALSLFSDLFKKIRTNSLPLRAGELLSGFNHDCDLYKPYLDAGHPEKAGDFCRGVCEPWAEGCVMLGLLRLINSQSFAHEEREAFALMVENVWAGVSARLEYVDYFVNTKNQLEEAKPLLDELSGEINGILRSDL